MFSNILHILVVPAEYMSYDLNCLLLSSLQVFCY